MSESNPIPRIVIVGRPNTGKSTLFNRFVGRRRALVHNMPGVTRDRLEEPVEWIRKVGSEIKKIPLLVVDTGGLGGERFVDEIKKQVQIALEMADLVLFVFDSQAGLTPLDEELLAGLHRSGVTQRIPVVGVVNKVDAEVHEERHAEFYSSGLDPILTISAEHGRGIDDLKAEIMSVLATRNPKCMGETVSMSEDSAEDEPETEHEAEDEIDSEDLAEFLDGDLEEEVDLEDAPKERRVPRIAIVGRPNVGKSTLVNAILGEQRMITSPIAGTTIDAIDSVASLNDKLFVWVDTAGIRRKDKTEQGVEVLSVVQTRKALEKADVAILLMDAETGITDQDEKIGGLIEEVGCSVILVLNKWDKHKRTGFTRDMAAEIIREEMGFLKYAPILFMSAIEGRGFEDLGNLLEEIMQQRRVKIATHEFTEWVRDKSTIHNPANAKFYLCHQAGRHPPTFVCHVNDPDKVHFSLRRHMANALRERWGFMGSPIRLLFVQAKNQRSMPRPRLKPKTTKRLKRAKLGL